MTRNEASNRQRADFLHEEYGVDWQAPALYNLILTTDRLPVEPATAAIVAAADLLQRSPEVIRHAVYAGDLPAKRAGQAIISIARKDLVGWLVRAAAPPA